MSRVGFFLLVVSGLVFIAALTGCQRDRSTAQAARAQSVAVDDGLFVDYVDWGGKGETLLFLPGVAGQTDYFTELAPHLTGRFRVLSLCASSARNDEIRDAHALCDFLDLLGIERVHFVYPSLSQPRLSRFTTLFPQRAGTVFCLELDHDRANIASSYYGFPSAYGDAMLRETRRAFWAAVADRMKRVGRSPKEKLKS